MQTNAIQNVFKILNVDVKKYDDVLALTEVFRRLNGFKRVKLSAHECEEREVTYKETVCLETKDGEQFYLEFGNGYELRLYVFDKNDSLEQSTKRNKKFQKMAGGFNWLSTLYGRQRLHGIR